jgi:dienelactone hydrolase
MSHKDFRFNVWAAVVIAMAARASLGQEAGSTRPRQAPSYPDHTKLLVVGAGDGRELPVKSPADWSVRRDHILAHFQEVAGPLPGGERRVPLEIHELSTTREKGFVRKKISFATEPGDRVPAWLLIPDDATELGRKRPAALCLHQTISIGKDEPAGLGSDAELAYALELTQRGYVTLSPDYPNFGEYKVNVYDLGYASATMKAIWNNLRGVDVLCSLQEVDSERIGVIGHSLGGHNSVFTALFDQRIKAVVSSCGYNAFPYYYKGNIAGWSDAGYMPRLRDRYKLDLSKVPFDFPELIGALAPRAFFSCSPLADSNFDVEGVRVCASAAKPVFNLLNAPESLVVASPQAEHSFPKKMRQDAYRFLDRFLR